MGSTLDISATQTLAMQLVQFCLEQIPKEHGTRSRPTQWGVTRRGEDYINLANVTVRVTLRNGTRVTAYCELRTSGQNYDTASIKIDINPEHLTVHWFGCDIRIIGERFEITTSMSSARPNPTPP